MPQLDTNDRADSSMTTLVTGILNDAQELIKQQFTLFKSEVRSDLAKTREAALTLSAAVAVLALGGMVLTFMAAHLVNWALELPTWGGFGIVGAALVIPGAILYAVGRNQLASLNPLPDQTVQSVKENAQWLTNPK